MPRSNEEIEQSIALARQATAAPWVVPPYDQAEIAHRHLALGTYPLCDFDFNIGVHGTRQVTPYTMGNVPDCEFICDARNNYLTDLSDLLAMRKEVERLRELADQVRVCICSWELDDERFPLQMTALTDLFNATPESNTNG